LRITNEDTYIGYSSIIAVSLLSETYYRLSKENYDEFNKTGGYTTDNLLARMEKCDTKEIDLKEVGKIVSEYIKRDENVKYNLSEHPSMPQIIGKTRTYWIYY